jgi:amino acid transporter
MKAAVSRGMMALAVRCLGESRREWAAAMLGEFEIAASEGKSLRFATGCLAAAWRGMVTREEGRFTLTNYALALGLMIPMAALQIGCALFGLPYLYPGQGGLPGALLEGGAHEPLMRGTYQAAVPSLALLLLVLGLGHLRIAWALLDRDWTRVTRTGTLILAAAVTLIIVLSVFFLDCTQALLQAAVLAIELAIVSVVARWHAQLFPAALAEHPG